MLNRQKGNMYGFVTNTWNVIKGKCIYNCKYCYMKKWKNQKPVRFDEKELKTDLGKDNFIFVGSSCDMFADNISDDWIFSVIRHCCKYNNKYLFQSKNPWRFERWKFPVKTVLATTIESNINYNISNAPNINNRIEGIKDIINYKKMITIEPILDFDVKDFVKILLEIKPDLITIGGNTSNYDLTEIEPSKEKINRLINELKNNKMKIYLKDNLKRLRSDNG